MTRAVMAIYALHVEFQDSFGWIRSRTGTHKGLSLSGRYISVFDPRNSLPSPVGRSEADMNAWPKVSAVNAEGFTSPYHHQKDCLCARVYLVIGVLVDYAQSHVREFP